MSFVIAAPEFVTAAASDVANIGSTISAANAAAAGRTTAVIPAAADEVSAAITSLFNAHAQGFQAFSAQAAAFHDQFVQLVNAGGTVCGRRGRQCVAFADRATGSAQCGECAYRGAAGTPADRQRRQRR
jgi:PE family